MEPSEGVKKLKVGCWSLRVQDPQIFFKGRDHPTDLGTDNHPVADHTAGRQKVPDSTPANLSGPKDPAGSDAKSNSAEDLRRGATGSEREGNLSWLQQTREPFPPNLTIPGRFPSHSTLRTHGWE